MLIYLLVAIFCSLVTGIRNSNNKLVYVLNTINENLIKDASEVNPQKAAFTKLLHFNELFVETNEEPNKDNIFSYVHTYTEALSKVQFERPPYELAAKVLQNLKEYYDVIGDRVDFVSKNCSQVQTSRECAAKLEEFDRGKEKYCPEYSTKFVKLYQLSLSRINDIARLLDEYVRRSRKFVGFGIKKYLKDNILKNAYGLVPLSANYQYLKLNEFPCYYNGFSG